MGTQPQPQQPQTRARVRGRFADARDPLDRFWGHVDIGCPDGCWLWSGRLDRDGYPLLRVQGADGRWRDVRAHRWLWEQIYGPIPGRLPLDHVCHSRSETCRGGRCRHRRCVRPSHLEPVTIAEHNRRTRDRRAQ